MADGRGPNRSQTPVALPSLAEATAASRGQLDRGGVGAIGLRRGDLSRGVRLALDDQVDRHPAHRDRGGLHVLTLVTVPEIVVRVSPWLSVFGVRRLRGDRGGVADRVRSAQSS
jgi:hypothetical protein